jgi:photosystem II stability/assembly factor-like uncharacterized protein
MIFSTRFRSFKGCEMQRFIAIVFLASATVMAAFGCKKSTTTSPGGGGGGGGGWLVGTAGLVSNVQSDGAAATYPVVGDAQLNSIACRYAGEAWITGDDGTLLYTDDGGTSWSAQVVPATGNLRGIATQDSGPVFVVGDGTFLTTSDTGKTWTSLATPGTSFVSVATAQSGTAVLAVDATGGVWSYDEAAGVLAQRTTVTGARGVALSPDGQLAELAGAGLWQSADSGMTWTQLSIDPTLVFDAVRIDENGDGVAVGSAGAIASFDNAGHSAVQRVGTMNLHALHIPDSYDTTAVGYAAGDDGAVFITDDWGSTWTPGPNVGKTVWGVDVIGVGHN